MTQVANKNGPNAEKQENSSEEEAGQTMMREKREKNNPPTKVVIRRLPPSMTLEVFLDQISPVPDNDYLYFVKADASLGPNAFSRAYVNFLHQEDIFVFKEKFDGYIFVDRKGSEYPAVIEFAPFQKIPKKKPKKCDAKSGTIEQDPAYLKFLESLSHPEEVNLPSAEFCLEEIETREREMRANIGGRNSTPLIEYLKHKKAEKLRIREEKREERKRREVEKKRQKEEERRRKRAEKEKGKDHESGKEKSRTGKDNIGEERGRTEPVVKLLKNPEREKPKEAEKDANPEDAVYRGNKGSRDGPDSNSRVQSAKDKDWESDRERRRHTDDKLPRLRDRPRERRERERPRRDREDQVKSGVSGKVMQGRMTEKSRMIPTTSRTSEWHSERSERAAYRSVSGNDSRTSKGKGKSYEKSRESLSKARNEVKEGLSSGIVESEITQDLVSESSEMPNTEICDREESVAFAGSDKTATESSQEDRDCELDNNTNDCKDEVKVEHHSYRRERASRDPRTERRIRNKDRPSIELYRPGMRRLSLQRNSPQKESSSSSPSPTMSHATRNEAPQEDDGKTISLVGEQEVETVDIAAEDADGEPETSLDQPTKRANIEVSVKH